MLRLETMITIIIIINLEKKARIVVVVDFEAKFTKSLFKFN